MMKNNMKPNPWSIPPSQTGTPQSPQRRTSGSTNGVSPKNTNSSVSTTSDSQSGLAPLTCASPLSSRPGESQGDLLSALGRVAMPPEMLAVGEFLATMKKTIGILGSTMECLCDQTTNLTPVIESAAQVAVVERDLHDQLARQEIRAKEVADLLDGVLKQLSDNLHSRLDSIINEIIGKKVEERVRLQSQQQIPEGLLQQSRDHKSQIMEVHLTLHNFDARRYNATLRSSSLSEPLRPLLRPLATPLQSPPSRFANMSVPPTPIASTPLSASSTLNDFGPPTPSPLFPKDLSGLFNLGPSEAHTLAREYGLLDDIPEENAESDAVRGKNVTNSTGDAVTDVSCDDAQITKENNNRERNISLLMSHIGVPFQMVHWQSRKGDRAKLTPLIINY